MCSVLPLLPNLFACSSEEGDTAKVSHLCLPLQRDGSPVGQQVSFFSDTRFGHMAETFMSTECGKLTSGNPVSCFLLFFRSVTLLAPFLHLGTDWQTNTSPPASKDHTSGFLRVTAISLLQGAWICFPALKPTGGNAY